MCVFDTGAHNRRSAGYGSLRSLSHSLSLSLISHSAVQRQTTTATKGLLYTTAVKSEEIRVVGTAKMGKSPSPCETISLWPHNSLAGLDVKAATEAVTQNPCGNIFPYFQTCLDFCINAGEIKPFFFLYLLYLDDRTHEFVKKKN